jgi:hypothetical protein
VHWHLLIIMPLLKPLCCAIRVNVRIWSLLLKVSKLMDHRVSRIASLLVALYILRNLGYPSLSWGNTSRPYLCTRKHMLNTIQVQSRLITFLNQSSYSHRLNINRLKWLLRHFQVFLLFFWDNCRTLLKVKEFRRLAESRKIRILVVFVT